MLRWFFSVLCLLSLLLCIAVCALWQLGRANPPDEAMRVHFSWLNRGSRYTAVLHSDRIRINGPPAVPANADPLRREILARIRNSDVLWQASASDLAFKELLHAGPAVFGPPLHEGDPWSKQSRGYQIPDPQTRTPLLLEALEDPDRFVIAHIGLVEIHEQWQSTPRIYERRPDGAIHVTYFGLEADLFDARDVRTDSSDTSFAEFTPRIAPEQQAVIRDYWHRRLDVGR
jgi:hypothetical protein